MIKMLDIDPISITFVQSFSSPLLDVFFQLVTHLGNPVFWLVVSAVFFWVGKEKASLYLTNLVLFSAVAVEILKLYFLKPRPESLFGEQITLGDSELYSKYSFPSGHATLSFAVFSFYATHKNLILSVGLIGLALLVGLSRIYLGLHFVSDIIAGLFLGLVIGQFNKIVSSQLYNAKLKFSRSKEEFLILGAFIASIVVLSFSEFYAFSAIFFGYYIGFFMIRETQYKHSKLSFKHTILKMLFGFAFIGVFFWIAFNSISQNFLISYLMFLILGLWVTLLYPLLFERMLLKYLRH